MTLIYILLSAAAGAGITAAAVRYSPRMQSVVLRGGGGPTPVTPKSVGGE